MFEGLKKWFKGFEYVCNVNTIFEYMERELEFSIDNGLEASANFYIYYKDKKYHVLIWNFEASSFPEEREKGLSVTLDEIEFNSLDNFKANAKLDGELLANIKENLKIELKDTDSVFLNEYKENHPDIQ